MKTMMILYCEAILTLVGRRDGAVIPGPVVTSGLSLLLVLVLTLRVFL